MTPAVAKVLACITLPVLIGSVAVVVVFVMRVLWCIPNMFKNQDHLWRPTPDDFTPRIVWNEGEGVMVKFGNTPHYKFYSEKAAKALPNVKDER